MRGKKVLGVALTLSALALLSVASASTSLLAEVAFLRAERVRSLDETITLDKTVRFVAALLGKTCVLTEHHRFSRFAGGLSRSNLAQVREALESEGWTVKEVVPFSRSTGSGVWYAVRGKERWKRHEVLVVLSEPHENARAGYFNPSCYPAIFWVRRLMLWARTKVRTLMTKPSWVTAWMRLGKR